METVRSATAWFSLHDPSGVGAVRRAAMRLAERLGFDESRGAEAGIVASEIATNVHRHGRGGAVGVQVALREEDAGIELIAMDKGPGMADLPFSRSDGTSTGGTLGLGLGAIGRLSSSVDVSSHPGRGTVLAARLWRSAQGTPAPGDVTGLSRPLPGEQECGDCVAARFVEGHHLLLAADGLGHGPMAAVASQEAMRIFLASTALEPADILGEVHRGLSHTRGAAAAIARIDVGFREVTLAGIGNISAFACDRDRRQSLVSYPGIVGHNAGSIRQMSYPIAADAVVVLHSDGLRESWSLKDTPGLLRRSAAVIAGALLRDFGDRRDDASVLVARSGD